jgi:hypothetical protein
VTYIAIVSKVGLALMLAIAGAAKLADLSGFASTIRLFMPRRRFSDVVFRRVAGAIAGAEILLGTVSLSLPAASRINLVVLAAGLGFVTVSLVGYALYRGRSCNCFGALSARRFDAAGILRGVFIVIAASLASVSVHHSKVDVDLTVTVVLVCCSLLLAVASFTAARSLAASRPVYRRHAT